MQVVPLMPTYLAVTLSSASVSTDTPQPPKLYLQEVTFWFLCPANVFWEGNRVSEEDRITKLEEDLKRLESRINFRVLLVALGALAATIVACAALAT